MCHQIFSYLQLVEHACPGATQLAYALPPSTEEEIQGDPLPIPRAQALTSRREEEEPEEEPQTPTVLDVLRRGLAGIRMSLGG